jgi:hypothetical protein
MASQQDFTAEIHFTAEVQHHTARHAAVAIMARSVDSTAAARPGATPLVVLQAWEAFTVAEVFTEVVEVSMVVAGADNTFPQMV